MNQIKIFLLVIFCAQIVVAKTVKESWLDFQKNPKQFMNQIPTKYADPLLKQPLRVSSVFSDENILKRQFVEDKVKETKACRPETLNSGFKTFAAIGHNDAPQQLLGNEFIKSIHGLHSHKEAKVTRTPWSGDYWAIAKGILANRYMSDAFNLLGSWKERFDYSMANPFTDIFNRGNDEEIHQLALSEKYDLVTNLDGITLSFHNWAQGKAYYDEYGKVESWMGICHGWAPASIMIDKPNHSVKVTSLNGEKEIEFLPDEIKGLASYVWANNPYPNQFAGNRCNQKNPKQDENGRVIDPVCFDSNPATWHLVATNLIGAQDKSFVMDATHDYEVWNQPVFSYRVSYFNVTNGETVATPEEAIVSKADFIGDIFSQYRSPEAKKFVGIAMTVGYIVESTSSDSRDRRDESPIKTWVRYMYDLELDADDNIIGGEWYTNVHPDFLFKPQDNAQAKSYFDYFLNTDEWSGEGPLPSMWKKAAGLAAREGKALNTIMEALIKKAAHP